MINLDEYAGIRLDIGCGGQKQTGAGWIGMDRQPLPGVDVVWNWNDIPVAFPRRVRADGGRFACRGACIADRRPFSGLDE